MPKAINGWKVCSHCRKEKPVSEFSKASSRADGYQYYCKICAGAFEQQSRQHRKDEGPTIVRDAKVCPKCKEEKPISEFSKCSTTADGYESWCKACEGIYNQQRRQRLQVEGPTIIRTTKVCPQCYEKKPISEFYKSNSTADGLYGWCKVCHGTYNESYRQTEEGKASEARCRHKRQAFKADAISDLTPEDFAILAATYPVCVYCGHEFIAGHLLYKRTLEHFVPYSRGGQNTFDNVAFACTRCNSSKGSKLLEEWTDRWYEQKN